MQCHIISSAEDMGEEVMKNKLKIYRAMHHLTQEQLAERVEVSRQTVNAIESNKYLPSLALAFRMAKLFHVTIEDIFFYET